MLQLDRTVNAPSSGISQQVREVSTLRAILYDVGGMAQSIDHETQKGFSDKIQQFVNSEINQLCDMHGLYAAIVHL